ncbi:MarR family transcriptional regulator [Microbacteriaceae bacterium VKM Ac-2855]|nr:MarR family transcriptional regulator [Microbacteriaceae bacterium VKM Ac-2855]
MRPLVGPTSAKLRIAMHAFVTWSTASSSREELMRQSDFPLRDDLPAFLLVNQLIYRGAVRPSDVADAIQTGTSNISKIVRRLEDADLVTRMADPNDQRATVIVLTEYGRTVAERISAAIDRTSTPAAEGWTVEEFETLERLVLKLVLSLDSLPNSPLSTVSGVNLWQLAAKL